jgi:hypothetical protein
MLPQPSVAVIMNVRVISHGDPESTWDTLVLSTEQLSVAATNAFTLASVGKVAGLQPKLLLVGLAIITGALVSVVQAMVCMHDAVLP